MTRRLLILSLGLLLGSTLHGAETFIFKNGAQLDGELVNDKETPRKRYVIRTGAGELTVAREQVQQVIRRRPVEVELERLRHEHPDTPEGQWALSEWCRQNSLLEPRKQFLQRILELDPDHARARAALGYSKFDGQWKTQDQVQTERGYVKHKGKWLLPQEVENEKRDQEGKIVKQVWYQKIDLWRSWLNSDRRDEGRRQLLAIRDPLAWDAIKYQLEHDASDGMRILFVEILAGLDTDAAWNTLAQRALDDPNEEVRQTCLDFLDDAPRPAAVKLFVDRLRSSDNSMVNRAGVGLRRLGDPSAVPALIDALVTKHRVQVAPATPAGSTSATFSPQGGGFSAGGGGPQFIEIQAQNQAVLDALVTLTSVSFNWDTNAWRQWYASQNRGNGVIDIRRGP